MNSKLDLLTKKKEELDKQIKEIEDKITKKKEQEKKDLENKELQFKKKIEKILSESLEGLDYDYYRYNKDYDCEFPTMIRRLTTDKTCLNYDFETEIKDTKEIILEDIKCSQNALKGLLIFEQKLKELYNELKQNDKM